MNVEFRVEVTGYNWLADIPALPNQNDMVTHGDDWFDIDHMVWDFNKQNSLVGITIWLTEAYQ